MEEESASAADAAVLKALKDVEHYTTRIKAFEDSPNFRRDDNRYNAWKESLKEARAYHLSLMQPGVASSKKQRIEAIYPNVLEFIAVAQGLSLPKVSGTLVSLPQNFLGATLSMGLFIRQEYVDVAHIIQAKLALNKSIKRVLVLGSPGIGKSVFGVLLFLFDIKQKKTLPTIP